MGRQIGRLGGLDNEFSLSCLFSCSVDEDVSEKGYRKRKKGSQHFLIHSLFGDRNLSDNFKEDDVAEFYWLV